MVWGRIREIANWIFFIGVSAAAIVSALWVLIFVYLLGGHLCGR